MHDATPSQNSKSLLENTHFDVLNAYLAKFLAILE